MSEGFTCCGSGRGWGSIPDTGSQRREALSLGVMHGYQRRPCVVHAQGSGAGELGRSVDLVRLVGSPRVQPLPTLDRARRSRRKGSRPSWFRVSTQPSRHVPGVNVGSGEVFCRCSRARESTETCEGARFDRCKARKYRVPDFTDIFSLCAQFLKFGEVAAIFIFKPKKVVIL